jgi:cystinosin
MLSIIKVLLTIIKYVPQALSHIRSRSTLGFSITQVLLDTAGGVFSLVQLVLDSYGDGGGWEGVATSLADNPGKLGLAGVSLFFDAVFIIQHYVLYGPVSLSWQAVSVDSDAEGEQRALLGSSGLRDRSRSVTILPS